MIYLDKTGKEPLYIQIYTQIREEILNGTLKEGDVIAGSRGLAKTLDISRNTVDNAYGQLAAEGYIAPRRGIGYQVQRVPRLPMTGQPQFSKGAHGATEAYAEKPSALENVIYDLTNSSHTSDLFPKSLWRKYTLEGIERLEKEARLSIHLNRQGEQYLRCHLRSYLERIRGVRCGEEQIIITAGIQQSLDIICKLLWKERPVILMEEPGYNKAAAVFFNHDMEVKTVPVDENGLMVSGLPEGEEIGAVYCTPSHQFPTGAVLPVGRRYELLHWAKRVNAYVIEDDFDSELQYYAKPIPSLQSIDGDNRVIYLGTFSKALSPSVRMGYMILPPRLMEEYDSRFEYYNSTVPLLNQYVIGRLIETGNYDRHIRRLNHVFRKRCECFADEWADALDTVKISGNGRGQYFLMEFSEKADQRALIDAALQYGVRVYSTMQFWQEKADCPPNTLFLGLGKINTEEIPDCVARLKKAWSKWLAVS